MTSFLHKQFTTGIAALGALLLALTACQTTPADGSAATETPASGADGEAAAAPDYPSRAVSLIVPYAAGGGTDTTIRPFAKALERELGGSVIVENRTGGAGVVGINDVYRAEPDGYTIGTPIDSIVTVQPQTNPDVDFDYESFKSVQVASVSMLVVTRADAPWGDLADFLADAESQPGELSYGIPGIATDNDLNGRALMQAADVELDPVPFAGGGADSLAALLRGDVDTSIIAYSTVRGQVEAGELKVLGVLGSDPLDAVPDAPTLSDLGLESDFFRPVGMSLAVPNETPDAVVDVISDAAQQALQDDELVTAWANNGITADFRSVEETADYQQGLSESLTRLFDLYPDLTGDN